MEYTLQHVEGNPHKLEPGANPTETLTYAWLSNGRVHRKANCSGWTGYKPEDNWRYFCNIYKDIDWKRICSAIGEDT